MWVYSTSLAASCSVYFPLASAEAAFLRAIRFLRSLSIFSLVMTTLDGWMPTLAVAPANNEKRNSNAPTYHGERSVHRGAHRASQGREQKTADSPLAFSRVARSTWMTNLRRYTWVTLPSRSLKKPRTMETSSSLRMGRDMRLTPRSLQRSLDRRADMIFRRTLEGAEKCALRLRRREEETPALN